jgi:hypothetical protein
LVDTEEARTCPGKRNIKNKQNPKTIFYHRVGAIEDEKSKHCERSVFAAVNSGQKARIAKEQDRKVEKQSNKRLFHKNNCFNTKKKRK